MIQTKKFLFDHDFEEQELKELELLNKSHKKDKKTVTKEEPPEVVVPTFSEEELAFAKEQAFAEGREEGLKEANTSLEHKIPSLLESINSEMAGLFKQQDILNKSTSDGAIQVAISIARKCFPALSVNNGLDQIRQMVVDILPQVIDEPRIFIQIHPDMLVHLKEHMAKIVEEAHFDGKIILKSVDSLGQSDCKIEWTNGGAERNVENIWQKIDDIIERNFGRSYSDIVPELSDLRDEEEENNSSDTETSKADDNPVNHEDNVAEDIPKTSEAPLAEAIPQAEPDSEPKVDSKIEIEPELEPNIEVESELEPEIDSAPEIKTKIEPQNPQEPLD